MKSFFRRSSQPEDKSLPARPSSFFPGQPAQSGQPASPGGPSDDQQETLGDVVTGDEQEDMFAGRGDDGRRSIPAHLRPVMNARDGPLPPAPGQDGHLRPSERFARPQGVDIPSLYSPNGLSQSTNLPSSAPLPEIPQRSVSAGTPPPALSPPAPIKKAANKLKVKTVTTKEQGPPTPPTKSPISKRSFFRFGGTRPASPSVTEASPMSPMSPPMPLREEQRPRREGRPESMLIAADQRTTPRSSPMPTPTPEESQGPDFFAAAQDAPPSAVSPATPIAGQHPFDRAMLQGYTSPPAEASTYIPQSAQPPFPPYASPSHAFPSSTPMPAPASSFTLAPALPRAVMLGNNEGYSPLAAFLGGTASLSSSTTSAPAPIAGAMEAKEETHDSPTGQSDTEHAYSKLSSFDSPVHSTPATSECGGSSAFGVQRPLPPIQSKSTEDRDELLALYEEPVASATEVIPTGQEALPVEEGGNTELPASTEATSQTTAIYDALALSPAGGVPPRISSPPLPSRAPPPIPSSTSTSTLAGPVRSSTSSSSLREASLRLSVSSKSLRAQAQALAYQSPDVSAEHLADQTTPIAPTHSIKPSTESLDFQGPYQGPLKPWLSPPSSPDRPLPSIPARAATPPARSPTGSPLASPAKISREPSPLSGSPQHRPLPIPGMGSPRRVSPSPSQRSISASPFKSDKAGDMSMRDVLSLQPSLPPGAGPPRSPSSASSRSQGLPPGAGPPARMPSSGSQRSQNPSPQPSSFLSTDLPPLQPSPELKPSLVEAGGHAMSTSQVETPTHSVHQSLQAPIMEAGGSSESHISLSAYEAAHRLEQHLGEGITDERPLPPSMNDSVTGLSKSSSVASSIGRGVGGSEADISSFNHSTEPSSRVSSTIEDERAHKLALALAPMWPPICVGRPRFEHAFTRFPRTILSTLMVFLEWSDLRPLREVSHTLRVAFDVPETKELILERYLGKYGYRTHQPRSSYGGTSSMPMTPVDLSLRDLEAFLTGREFAPSEFAELAREHSRKPLDIVTLRMIRASMRAWNRLVMRCRVQGGPYKRPPPGVTSIYKEGRAACLRVWVPLGDPNWMNDEEVVACEKEVWRAGVWSLVQKGDLIWNVAQGDFANEGKLLSDSRFLRDLSYSYDHVGHLPNWLNAICYSPGHWHNVLASSDPNHPIIFTSLAPFSQQIQQTLVLLKENVEVPSAHGRHRIQRYVYRANVQLRAGTLIGAAGGAGNGPGGIDCVHPDWAGHLIVETEGTSEHAQELMRRCAVADVLTPFRVVRERSRPGKLVIRPVLEAERIA